MDGWIGGWVGMGGWMSGWVDEVGGWVSGEGSLLCQLSSGI